VQGANLYPETTGTNPRAVVTVGGLDCPLETSLCTQRELVCTVPPLVVGGKVVGEALQGLARNYDARTGANCESRLAIVVVVPSKSGGGDITSSSWNSQSRHCIGNHAWCRYSYLQRATPEVHRVVPRSAAPGELITIGGRTCIGDTLDGGGERVVLQGLKRFERILLSNPRTGDIVCQPSSGCDVTTTRECPTFFTSTIARPDAHQRSECYEGEFSCRLPAGLPAGHYNVSFRLPKTHGMSLLTAAAITVGVGPAEPPMFALEVTPTLVGVEVYDADADLLLLTAEGLDAATR
jgi:hypothetical protein